MKTNMICKKNWTYYKVKEILSQFSNEEIKIVKDHSNLLIVQTFSVEPFQKMFISNKVVKNDTDSCDWCFCSNDINLAKKTYNDFTKNGKNQQYIAFDFTKEFSKENGCIIAFTVENDKITWSHIMNNALSNYVKDCNPILLTDKEFKNIY